MTTRITKTDEPENDRMVLKLEGNLSNTDARLLSDICTDLRQRTNRSIAVDLAGVDFITNEGALILCHLKTLPKLTLHGLHLFVQQLIEATEAGLRGE